MELNEYIIILTFLPWLLFLILSLIYNLNKKEYRSFSGKYFKKNILNLFRLDTLFLIVVFYYFASFDMEFVAQYLFVVMCIYLFMNSFYEKKEKLNKAVFKDNIISCILLFILAFIPVFIYFREQDLFGTYKLMLFYLFLEYPMVLIVCYINKGIKKLFKRY